MCGDDEKYLEHSESSSPVGKLKAFLMKFAAELKKGLKLKDGMSKASTP